MSDIADRAEAYEQNQRNDAIERITRRQLEAPLLDKYYHRICRECEAPIHFQRLVAVPHAVRCYDCQVIVELRK